MAGWILENVYESDGTELSTAGMSTSLSGAFAFAHDGRYVWVTNGTGGVYIYEYWGAKSDDEPEWAELDELTLPRYNSGIKQKPRLVTVMKITATHYMRSTREESLADVSPTEYSIGTEGEKVYFKSNTASIGALNATFIAKVGNKMYVASGSQFQSIYVFDIDTQRFTGQMWGVSESFNGVARGMNSNLCASGGRLWFVGGFSADEPNEVPQPCGPPVAAPVDSARQKLYALSADGLTKTAYDLEIRPTLARTWLADGMNGYVYATCYNDVAVVKVDNLVGTQTYLRVNAFPTRVWAGPDRRIWVNSYAGMLTLVDYDDDGTHPDWSTEQSGALAGAVDLTDGTKFWYVAGDTKLVRIDLNDNTQLEQGGGANDWEFQHPKLQNPFDLLQTGAMTYQDAALADVEVKPYLFMLDSGKLRCFRLDNYLYRKAYAELRGQSAVSSGPEFYFGET